MDKKGPATRAPLPLPGWQALTPVAAAREVHARISALPDPLRHAALACLRSERDLAEELAVSSPSAPLRGVPYLVKDLFDVAGLPTTAGSAFLAKVRPTPDQSSALVRRLHELGTALVGKTQLVEFAAGLTGENRTYGDCPHPHFADRLSGGSSSGSAALVGAGVVPLAIGTDTGGSVRVPAAFCGVYGLRLTPAHEWIRDAFPLSPTCDTPGWFTANAADMLSVTRALIGATESETAPRGCYLDVADLGHEFDRDLAHAVTAGAARLAPPADTATKASLLAAWSTAIDTYTTVVMHEANAIHRNWLAPYHENYDPVIWQRFTDGGHYPAEQLVRAQENSRLIRETWRQFFARYDFLVMPCAPFPALRKAECTPEARRAILRLTAPASLGGLPVLTIPVPLPSGLTGGLQIIAKDAASPVFPWALRPS